MELAGTTEATPGADGSQAQDGMTGPAQIMWRKSSYSTYNGNCVEVARLSGGLIGVRDSKDEGSGLVLVFRAGSWHSFVTALKDESGHRS